MENFQPKQAAAIMMLPSIFEQETNWSNRWSEFFFLQILFEHLNQFDHLDGTGRIVFAEWCWIVLDGCLLDDVCWIMSNVCYPMQYPGIPSSRRIQHEKLISTLALPHYRHQYSRYGFMFYLIIPSFLLALWSSGCSTNVHPNAPPLHWMLFVGQEKFLTLRLES